MDEARREHIRQLLVASVLGAEVDLEYRVLALTVEPTTSPESELDAAPDVATDAAVDVGRRAESGPGGDAPDRRLQVLFHPVGTIAAALVRHAPDSSPPRTVLTFDIAQLPDVVAALDGPVPIGDPLPDALPNLHAMEERLSLRGMAQVAEGHRHPLALSLVADDLTLDLWATFDVVEVRTPDGQVVEDA